MTSSIAYEAAVAGFTYSAESTHSGISLKFAGFSQKLPNLVDYCTSLMATGTIQADKFNQIKNQYAFDLANVAYTDAWSQTMLDLGLLLVPEGWAYTDMLNALQTTTLANLESYKKCLFASFRAESFGTGNILPGAVANLTTVVLTKFAQTTLIPTCPVTTDAMYKSTYHYHIYNIDASNPKKSWIFTAPQTNPADNNNAITAYFQFGLVDPRNTVIAYQKACFDFIVYVIRDSFFNQLRTIQTLGYIVRAFTTTTLNVVGLSMQVQSQKTPDVLLTSIQEFLEPFFLAELSSLNVNDFASLKLLLAEQKLQQPFSIQAQADIIWREILTQEYVFDRAELEATAVNSIILADVIPFYQRLIQGGLFVKVYGTNVQIPVISPQPNVYVINSINGLNGTTPLYLNTI